MSVTAAAAAATAAAARLGAFAFPVREVQPVRPFKDDGRQLAIDNKFDELPCAQCAVPDDLRRAPPADFHCHICRLPGQGWERVDEYYLDDLKIDRTTDGHFICTHRLCASVWELKCDLDVVDEEVKSGVVRNVSCRLASGEVYEALAKRMLCYNRTMTRQVVSTPKFLS